MPKFQLHTSGKAYKAISETSKEAVRWRDLDEVTQGYVTALFFTESDYGGDAESFDPENGSALPGDASFSDLAPETLAAIIADCAAFQATPEFKAFENWRDNDDSPDANPADDSQVGHDFWLTRNGHGAGFWDRPEHYYGPHQDALDSLCGWRNQFGGVDAYLGDDGKVYLS